jgi:Fe-S cluster assembly iron-binding protein IscA
MILQIKEEVMVEVTEAASKQIAEYFKDREVAPIRIFLNEGG